MKNQKRTRNHHDLGAPTVDWSGTFPLGVTPPLFARCLEAWLRHETPEVIKTVLASKAEGETVSVHAIPPGWDLPWRFQYRALSPDLHLTDPSIRWDVEDLSIMQHFDLVKAHLDRLDEEDRRPDRGGFGEAGEESPEPQA